MQTAVSAAAINAADYAVQFTLKSRNIKVGAMSVSTTSAITCPDSCPLKLSGCYADGGPLGMIWRALSAVTAGEKFKLPRGEFSQSLKWSGFCAAVKALPDATLWRHN